LIFNPIVGGSGGHAFQALAPPNESVKEIDLHCGYGTGDSQSAYVIRGIRLYYTNGSRSQLFGRTTTDTRFYYFNPSELVNQMSIRAAWRADAIRFFTTKGFMNACGGGGADFPQNIGNGTLVGFWGRAAFDVDALGSIFEI
jgi:jacalin-like lectin domain-containing protein